MRGSKIVSKVLLLAFTVLGALSGGCVKVALYDAERCASTMATDEIPWPRRARARFQAAGGLGGGGGGCGCTSNRSSVVEREYRRQTVRAAATRVARSL